MSLLSFQETHLSWRPCTIRLPRTDLNRWHLIVTFLFHVCFWPTSSSTANNFNHLCFYRSHRSNRPGTHALSRSAQQSGRHIAARWSRSAGTSLHIRATHGNLLSESSAHAPAAITVERYTPSDTRRCNCNHALGARWRTLHIPTDVSAFFRSSRARSAEMRFLVARKNDAGIAKGKLEAYFLNAWRGRDAEWRCMFPAMVFCTKWGIRSMDIVWGHPSETCPERFLGSEEIFGHPCNMMFFYLQGRNDTI